MKALTIIQPWASLIAIGAKKIETRSWHTSYRGPLAIHASKGFPKDARALCSDTPFMAHLGDHYMSVNDLPRGMVIATCQLVACTLTSLAFEERLTDQEKFFGDYSPGRFGWILEDVRPLAEPIPAKGALSLWEWSGV